MNILNLTLFLKDHWADEITNKIDDHKTTPYVTELHVIGIK